MELWVIVLGSWLVCGVVTAVVASSKGRSGFGWLLIGLLLGILALIMVGLMPAVSGAQNESESDYVDCPECAEKILRKAKRCKHCGSVIASHEDDVTVPKLPDREHGQSQNDYIDQIVSMIGASRKADAFQWNGASYGSFSELIEAAKK